MACKQWLPTTIENELELWFTGTINLSNQALLTGFLNEYSVSLALSFLVKLPHISSDVSYWNYIYFYFWHRSSFYSYSKSQSTGSLASHPRVRTGFQRMTNRAVLKVDTVTLHPALFLLLCKHGQFSNVPLSIFSTATPLLPIAPAITSTRSLLFWGPADKHLGFGFSSLSQSQRSLLSSYTHFHNRIVPSLIHSSDLLCSCVA